MSPAPYPGRHSRDDGDDDHNDHDNDDNDAGDDDNDNNKVVLMAWVPWRLLWTLS